MKLEKIRQIKGKIEIVTGLHIGASNETIEIGGLDNPIIKDPLPESNPSEGLLPGWGCTGRVIRWR